MPTSILTAADKVQIAREAVGTAQRQHAGALPETRDFLIADDACEIAGQRIFEATLAALGVEGVVTPFGYWTSFAQPHIAAVLGPEQCFWTLSGASAET